MADLKELITRAICAVDNDCAGLYCSGVCDSSYYDMAAAAIAAFQNADEIQGNPDATFTDENT